MRLKRPYRIRKKRSIFKNRFFWLILSILILGGVIFYFLIFSAYFQIKEVQILGNKKIQTQEIENLIEEKINQKILFYPTRSIFLANFSEIEKEISENFPQIAEVNLERNLPNGLTLKVKEREPLFLWCQDSQNCFYLDKEGIIFDPVRNGISNGADSVLIKIKSQGEPKLGKKIIEKKIVDFCQKAQLKLRDLGLSVKEFLVSEEKITAYLEQNFQIFFNPKEDPEQKIFNLSLVLEKEIPKEKRKNLEYIDLRFGNRVYYKYKGE